MQRVAHGLFEAAGAGRTVLAPNAELAAALQGAVERMHLAAGDGIWPTPKIRDFGGWLREQHARRQLSDAALPRVLGEVEERELWRSVIEDSGFGEVFLEPAGAARAARRARQAMADHGIPLRALAGYATEESLALLDWNQRFEQRCSELNCIGADQLLSSAPGDVPDLVWIDSPLWRPRTRQWLESHAIALQAVPATPASTMPLRYQAASPAAELAAMADWAGESLQASRDFRAWICIPDLGLRRAEVEDAFDAVLAPRRFSLAPGEVQSRYALAGGTPLSDYAPVRAALQALSATAGPVSFEEFSALLRMPELTATPADAGAAAILDTRLRSRGPSEANLNAWLTLSEGLLHEGRVPPALQRLRLVQRTVEGTRGEQRMSRWVSIWVAAFEAGPWAERHRWSSTEFQAAERFRELLAALATADRVFGPRSAATAAQILRRAARDTAFQPQTGIPPIWVSGQLMDPWLNYDGLWIAGCSEERWPPPQDPIPLLPVRLQREYGVVSASAEAQLRLAEDLQQRWQLRADSVVFSCADPGDGRTSALSPLLPVTSEAAIAPPRIRPHWHVQSEAPPPLERLGDERAPAFGPAERTRGVATIRAQSRCAFRGFAETRLASEPLDRPVPGFNARERGEMLHRALEYIWSALRTWESLKAIEPAHRERLIDEGAVRAIAEQCARRDPGMRWQRREAPRLRALLGKWLDTELKRAPFEVETLEQSAHGEGVRTARHGGLEYNVRIDRVDRLVDGGRVLIDYKTGMAAADWRGERPDNPQLPIYALLRPEGLVAVAYGRVNADTCEFVAETERRGVFKPAGRPSSLEGMPDFAALVALWSGRIEKIAAEFAAGHAEVAPTLRACESCRLQPLCRVPAALDEGASPDGVERDD